MKNENLQCTRAHAAGRIRLCGTVAGTQSCELVADGDDILVGSAAACDLPIFDPLVPPRAFRLRRIKCHAGPGEECRCHWIIESDPGARVYVNRHITRRERLCDGDTFETGCHRFVFTHAESESRNRRLHQNVADLCERLLARQAAPIGFIRRGPFHQHARRIRTGLSIAGGITVLLLLALLVPRQELFESVMPPLEVQVAENASIPSDAVRSLDAVARQAYHPAAAPEEAPDLAEKPLSLPPDPSAQPRMQALAKAEAPTLDADPVELGTLEPLAPPLPETPEGVTVRRDVAVLESAAPAPRRLVAPEEPDLQLARLADHAPASAEIRDRRPIQRDADLVKPERPDETPGAPSWQLPILPPSPVKTAATAVRRETAVLTGAAPPLRRLSISETVRTPAEAGETADLRPRAFTPAAGLVSRAAVRDALAALEKPAAEGLKADPKRAIEQLAAYTASPVRFESFMGMQVPVVRMAEQLRQAEIPGAADPIGVDGNVSQEEIAISWKSGRFKTHAPGQPPPDADPPTYCYVGKTEIGGKPHLYIAFTCVDPDATKILARAGSGNAASLIADDSVEIFLDTNCDRKDYFQFIANAKGGFWGGYYPRPAFENGAGTAAQAWNPGATVKTSVTREPSQWVCEIVIPFDKLGGVPAKGARWAVNFARNFRGQGADWQLQSWFAVYDKARNYHHPNLFGIFQW